MFLTNFALAATTALTTFVAEPDLVPVQAQTDAPYSDMTTNCNTAFELSPHGYLEPGTNIWVREPDLRDDGVAPACTSDPNIKERQDADVDDGDNPGVVCTVGPDGLNIGKGPFAGPDDEPAIVYRGQDGTCFIPPPAMS